MKNKGSICKVDFTDLSFLKSDKKVSHCENSAKTYVLDKNIHWSIFYT